MEILAAIGVVGLVIVLSVVVDMGIAWFFMTVWNEVIVSMFHVAPFTFWNMFFVVLAINLLASMFKPSTSGKNKS